MTDAPTTTLDNTRMKTWTPHSRPEWVQRLNEEGNYLDVHGIVPLDGDSLIARAALNTGLSYFGDDDWHEPFTTLVKGLDEEAKLTLMGRILTRSDLLMYLEARLRVEDMYKRHPEIEQEEIKEPIWVIGQGRSGTTLLHTLLVQPPENRTTTDGDALFPVPVPSWSPEQQREIGHARVTMWSRIDPHINSIHEFGYHRPAETFRLEAMGFRAPAWLNLLGLSPSYNAYIAQPNAPEKALEYGRRVYKLLQWQKPGGRWVLRSNDSIQYLPAVFKVFPDAKLVWSHRDPIRSLSSMVDMIGTMMGLRSDQQVTSAYEFVTNPAVTSQVLSRPIDWLASGEVPEDRLFNVQYLDLVRDPVCTVEAMYNFFNMEFSHAARKAIADYITAFPRDNRPAHRYSLGTDEQIRAEREAFRRYQEYFHVPNET